MQIDERAYRRALARSRAELGLSGPIRFEPSKHPRDPRGRFKDVLDGLRPGGSVELPGGTTVRKRSPGSFEVRDGRTGESRQASTGEAADVALDGGLRRKLSEEELAASVDDGPWTASADAGWARVRSGASTEDLHRPGGEWTEERRELHGRVIRLLTRHASSSDEPRALFLAGGAASGKSTVFERLDAPADAVDVNPDIVRRMLPEYQRLIDDGDPDAAAKTHEEASFLAKAALAYAQRRRMHVVVDGVGGGRPGKFADRVSRLADDGYDTTVDYVTVSVAEAERRATKRAKRSGRAVPLDRLRAGHGESSRRIVDLYGLPVRVRVWDNEFSTPEDGPRLIASKEPRERSPRVLDAVRWRVFQAKASRG